jgi:type IV pilus assembly protein PilF
MINFRGVVLSAVVVALSACTTTGSLPSQPEKWKPDKRAQAHVDLGLDYLRRGQFKTAREEFDLAISIDPQSATAYHGKGLLMAQSGYTEDAKKLFSKAVGIDANNFLAVNDYGTYLCQNGEIQKGIDVLKRVESRADNRLATNTQLGLGVCNFEQDDMAEAKKHFRAVLIVSPTLHQALQPMAEISFQEQNYLSARAFIERFIASGVLSEKILVLGVNTELELGDKEKARQYAKELRRSYPTSSEIEKFRSLLTNG